LERGKEDERERRGEKKWGFLCLVNKEGKEKQQKMRETHQLAHILAWAQNWVEIERELQ
jgi:hypothetical protein